MKHLLRFNEEKSIGSEAVRLKWYSDIDKSIFYKLVNIDPTSVRKKDFSKPGKYVKWLIRCYKQYKKRDFYEIDNNIDEYFDKKLNFFLFVFSTGWYSSKVKKGMYYISGRASKTVENDILKFKTLSEFKSHMHKISEEYKVQTEDAKYDIVYSDDKIDILIPLNFTASFETAKNTEWCSQSFAGYSNWSKEALLFRIIPKVNIYDKLKLTWRKDGRWYIACSKYPEISAINIDTPFTLVNGGKESWVERLDNMDKLYKDSSPDRWLNNSVNIRKTMLLLSKEAKDIIQKYYDKNKSL